MVPFVAIWRLHFNDVLFTALWAALNPVLLFLLLQHLRAPRPLAPQRPSTICG